MPSNPPHPPEAGAKEAPPPPWFRRAAPILVLLALWVVYGVLESLLWRKQLWGAHFFAYLPPAWWLAAPIALALMALPGTAAARGVGLLPARFAPWLAAIAAAILFSLLRTRHLFWGDGVPLSINIPQGQSFHPDEPLSLYLHHLIYRLGGGNWSGVTAVAIGSVLSGALFAGRTVQWLSNRYAEPGIAALAALCLLTQGFTQIFYGYVENYPYLAVTLLYFLTWGVDFLEGRIGPLRPLAAALVAAALHVMGWLAIVPTVYLVAIGLAQARRRRRLAFAVVLVIVAASLALHATAGLFGTETPAARVAGAARKLLAPRTGDGTSLPSPRDLGDLWSQFVIVGPLSLPLVAALFAWLRGPRFRHPVTGRFLCLASLVYSAPMLLVGGWGIGPARDWDIFAAPAVATALCGVLLVVERTEAALARRILVALAAASLFHTLPWVALNTSRERTMARVADLPLDQGRSQMMLGTYYLNSGDLPKAEHSFRAALAIDSMNVNSQSGLGLALARQGHYADALPSMRAAVRMSPAKREYRRDLAALLDALEQWEESASQTTVLLSLEPGDRRAWLGLARAYVQLGRLDSAALALDVARSHLPDDPEIREASTMAYEAWVVARARAGDWAEAGRAFTLMERRFPDDPRTARLRAGLIDP